MRRGIGLVLLTLLSIGAGVATVSAGVPKLIVVEMFGATW